MPVPFHHTPNYGTVGYVMSCFTTLYVDYPSIAVSKYEPHIINVLQFLVNNIYGKLQDIIS
jgi:hypothetical protein